MGILTIPLLKLEMTRVEEWLKAKTFLLLEGHHMEMGPIILMMKLPDSKDHLDFNKAYKRERKTSQVR